MSAKSYRNLATNSRYLKGVAFDSAESVLTPDDRVEAEDQAAVEIDAALGKSFSTSSTPALIRVLADLLGSAIILEWLAVSLNFGQDGEGARKPEWLRKKAQQIFDDLRAHKIGIDGDALYPAPDVLPTAQVGGAKNISIDAGLSWGQMAQGTISDDEKNALDPTRGRRASDLEAAFAGAYDL